MKTAAVVPTALVLLLASCGGGQKETRVDISMNPSYEGETVEMVTFLDSVPLGSAQIRDGRAVITAPAQEGPTLVQFITNGRVKGFAILEGKDLQFVDSLTVAAGSEWNDRFRAAMQRADSVDALDDLDLYARFAEQLYNENRDNVIGDYFGIEYIKFSDGTGVDSMLNAAPPRLAHSARAKKYRAWAQLRCQTAPGRPYVDFQAQNRIKQPVSLSSLIVPGHYTLVDFWASWCPYCIKELPEMKQLYADYNSRGLDIIGVAVRDEFDATQGAVDRHQIPWTVIYNAGRAPYNIYGFAGIPHHILIGPDGTIVSRGENVAKIRERLQTAMPN